MVGSIVDIGLIKNYMVMAYINGQMAKSIKVNIIMIRKKDSEFTSFKTVESM